MPNWILDASMENSFEVVLADLTIDLEVCALVRIPSGEQSTETVVLQRQGV